MAAAASTERAWPTAPTGAPNSRPTPTMVGARTTSKAWEALITRTNGMSRLIRDEDLPRPRSSCADTPITIDLVFSAF
jgi:hypothetical protein